MRWVVSVCWNDGEEEYLMEGDSIAVFPNRPSAENKAAFMRAGMDDVQSVNVVAYPL